MPLVRALAHPLLAAPFVLGGIKTLKDAETRTRAAAPFLKKISDLSSIPYSPELLVKAHGASMFAGGMLLATGKFSRLSSVVLAAGLVPSTIAGHAFWEKSDPGEKVDEQRAFAANLGLLGGLVLAAVDLEGKPGALYRAKMAKDSAARGARITRREARYRAKTAKREAKLAILQAQNAVT